MTAVPRGYQRTALQLVVGIAALAAPALHSLTDVLEWYQGAFSTPQLWLNYVAFLPMPWLLLGIYAVHEPRPGAAALAGALIYGAAFTYFAHTSLYALAERVPDYAALWQRLGPTYTLHGALMACGGVLFAASVLRAGVLRRGPVLVFSAGIVVNVIVATIPSPELLQTIGSAIRNLGLMGMGHDILAAGRTRRS